VSREKTAKLKQSRVALVVALFSSVLFCFAYILQVWEYPKYWPFLPGFGVATLFFFVFFLMRAPLCSDCRKRPWSIFHRTAICCFAEKVSLRKAATRTLKVIAIVYILGGVATVFIRPIYAYGIKATHIVEQKMRRPELERFLKEERELKLRLKADASDREARISLGWLYYRAGKTGLATREYAQLIKDNPEDAEGLVLHAIMLGEMNQTLQEEKTYEKVLELQPENPAALINLGIIYLRSGLYPRAQEKLATARNVLARQVLTQKKKVRRAEEDDPAARKDLEALTYHLGTCDYHLAIVYKLMKDKTKQQRHLDRAIKAGVSVSQFSKDAARYAGK